MTLRSFIGAFPERMRLSPGPLHPGDPDHDMLGDGTPMVRRGNGPFDQSRELAEAGVRVRRAGREATILGRSRAEGHPHIDLSDDWMLGAVDADAEEHTDAGAVRCLPVHGRRVAQRPSVLR